MQEENSNRIIKKFDHFYNTILNICRQIDTPEDRLIYLKTIINDCDRICETAELFDEYELDEDFLRKTNLDVDVNFYWLINDDVYGPNSEVINLVMEDKPSYMSFELNKLLESSSNFKIDGIRRIQMHLEFDSKYVCEKNEESNTTGNLTTNQEIERIKVKSSLADIVRIFEAMKKAEIISVKTPIKQFTELFFSDISDKAAFEKKYNAVKHRIDKERSSSNSEELVLFIITLCEEGFKRKEIGLERIATRIEQLQKNII